MKVETHTPQCLFYFLTITMHWLMHCIFFEFKITIFFSCLLSARQCFAFFIGNISFIFQKTAIRWQLSSLSDKKMRAKMLNTLPQSIHLVVDMGFGKGLIVNSRDHGSNIHIPCLPQNIGRNLNTLGKRQEK